ALTARERQLLGLMAQGHSNTAIARRLVVSASAVEKHIGNVFAKLGLPPDDDARHRRVMAVLAYLRGGAGPAGQGQRSRASGVGPAPPQGVRPAPVTWRCRCRTMVVMTVALHRAAAAAL